MKIVLDTNTLLQCYTESSRHYPIWEAFLNSKLFIVVSGEMLLEYEEILDRKVAPAISDIILETLLESLNMVFIQPSFHWNIITSDPDDNKFFDAAVAGNADYIVTNDKHFNAIKSLPFPPMKIISSDDFLQVVLSM